MLDDASRNVLLSLDGNHDRQALAGELVEAVDRGDVSILVGGIPASRGEAVLPILEQTLDAVAAQTGQRMRCLIA